MISLKKCILPVIVLVNMASFTSRSQSNEIELSVLAEFSIARDIGKLRAIPVQLGKNRHAILFAWSADKEIDPYIEMFYPPTDRMKMALYTLEGEQIWKKELGKGVVNGIWFTPVYPFDLNEDGTDEIYYVTNIDSVHILSYNSLRLESLDARTGERIGLWSWKRVERGSLSHTFRNFILGGYVEDTPVLITAQGTYGDMGIQAWNTGMKKRWEIFIPEDDPGAKGSHMCPVVDIDFDNKDELLWGERCIDLDEGTYQFIADKAEYDGHSDVIQPTLNRKDNKWYIFTCRESGDRGQIKPRVVMFDDSGDRVWTDLEEGHMDMGWTAHTEGENNTIAFTISRGGKMAGPDGFYRLDIKEYAYHAFSGEKINLPFNAYNTVPVDLDGDGFHEFACAFGEQSDRNVCRPDGTIVGNLGDKAYIAMASKFMDQPGEQILCYYPDGTIRIWYDKNARDSERAKKRYAHPYYQLARKLTGTGYNLVNLGGL